jgi:DNA-binding IclR family transcriptional regulator
MSARTPSENQSLKRGLAILEAYNSEKRNWGIRELSREFNINAATVHRLVSTLTKRGYLERNAKTQRYHLGPKVVQLAANYSSQKTLIEISLRLFKEYEKVFPYLFYLGVMSASREIISIAVYESHGPLKITSAPGQTVSMYSSALGKLLLANESDSFIRKLVADEPIERLTSRTVANLNGLMKQINEIRKVGYAINLGEIYEEVAAVATPVRGPDGNIVAGLSLTFPLHYLETKKLNLTEIIELAHTIGNKISEMSTRTIIR